jgi:hypothetical protein
MKKLFVLTAILMTLLTIIHPAYVDAAIYQVNLSDSLNSGQTENPAFIVNTLKYEPYPVNAGDWFDLWIQVQNAGQKDALNSKFEAIPDYPFSSAESLTKYFNIIIGTINANKNMKQGEQTPQENIIVIKYRIKAADNAKEGTNILNFKTSINGINEYNYELPIYIEKTKTDFAVTMRDSNLRRTTFSIANIGEKKASAIIVKINNDSVLLDKSEFQVIIGALEVGELSTVSFPIMPDKELTNIDLQIEYTDTSGIRSYVKKNVQVNIAKEEKIKPIIENKSFLERYSNWIYGLAGLVVGILVILLIKRRSQS